MSNVGLFCIVITLAAPGLALAQAPPPQAEASASQPAPPATTSEPLAGFSDGTAFLRSADGAFVLFPNGRLQVDYNAFGSKDPSPAPKPFLGFLDRRARAELAGWVGSWVFFNIAGDFAGGSAPIATDDYVALAPFGDLAILQAGQFDAPFTLENRTSDKYFDFMERSITVRAFAIPSNKELGAMVHGIAPSRLFYYSAGVFGGDGQNARNLDDNFDFMARAWVAPLALTAFEALRPITVGGSLWLGKRDKGAPFPAQTTQGGFVFLKPTWSVPGGMTGEVTNYELRQNGSLTAVAAELDVPIAHRYGVRSEYVHKEQGLASNAMGAGPAQLKGDSVYGQVWFWAIGDDKIVGAPGLQLPPRLKKISTTPPRLGLMLSARVERLEETISEAAGAAPLALANPVAGRTQVTCYELGATLWYSKRFRAMANYLLNHFGGDTPYVTNLKSKNEHELGLRLAIAL
jgi:phosphate-selective porin OprO and OprP